MVFQTYALYPHMTVAQNMGFGLKVAGRSKEEVEQKVTQAADVLQLNDYLDRRPGQLSGGNVSALPLDGPLSETRMSFCSMNRSPTLMPSCAWTCALRLPACISSLATR